MDPLLSQFRAGAFGYVEEEYAVKGAALGIIEWTMPLRAVTQRDGAGDAVIDIRAGDGDIKGIADLAERVKLAAFGLFLAAYPEIERDALAMRWGLPIPARVRAPRGTVPTVDGLACAW